MPKFNSFRSFRNRQSSQDEDQREDKTFDQLLSEAFAIMEKRYSALDKDGAGMIFFRSLEVQLALHGFDDHDTLQKVFEKVDRDKSGYLDFAEWLCLMFLWAGTGGYENILESASDCEIVEKAFQTLETMWQQYDANHSRKFSYSELQTFLLEQLPVIHQKSQGIIDSLIPEADRSSGKEMSFPRFMHLLYLCHSDLENSIVPGKYSKLGVAKQNHRDSEAAASGMSHHGAGGGSHRFRDKIEQAFKAVEHDFKAFDQSGDGYIDLVELTKGVPHTAGYERFQILSRIEHKFKMVDVDRSGSVDFFEFMYLGFLMTQDGSYSDLIAESEGAARVMKAYVDIHKYYVDSDTGDDKRLNLAEMQAFCRLHLGELPPHLDKGFAQLAYRTRRSRDLVVDIFRFLKLCYFLICPDGEFNPEKYNPDKQPSRAAEPLAYSLDAVADRLARFAGRILPTRFKKGEKIGEGGQGVVFQGEYEGTTCAGKVMSGKLTAELEKELKDEVELLMRLDHPHCQFLLGAKTTLFDGGPLILTELCEQGSLFDLYAKKQVKLDVASAWRVGREVASGLQSLHALGYMHRDVKSLNIFMAKNYSARVADFGMATAAKTATEACGTVQWMAPEVLSNFYNPGTSPYDKQCDVFSFGILLWEIFHCSCPYSEIGKDQMQVAKGVKLRNIRPQMNPSCPLEAQKLIMACWMREPVRRPDFKTILQAILPHSPV